MLTPEDLIRIRRIVREELSLALRGPSSGISEKDFDSDNSDVIPV